MSDDSSRVLSESVSVTKLYLPLCPAVSGHMPTTKAAYLGFLL